MAEQLSLRANGETNFITKIVQSPFQRPQSRNSVVQIGSSDPKGPRRGRAFSVPLCLRGYFHH